MARRIRGHDWRESPLGPAEAWTARLRTLVDLMLGSPQAVAIICARDRLLLYNDAAARALGARHPRVLGRPASEALAEAAADFEAAFDRAFAGEAVEIRARDLDMPGSGATPAFDTTLTPVREDDGVVAYVHAVGFDVGTRLREAAVLRESEAWLRKVLDIETVGVVFLDRAGRIRDANEAFLQMTGRSRAELATAGGIDRAALTPPEWRWRDARTVAELGAAGRAGPFETEIARADGARLWVLCAARRLGGAGAVEFMIDVTGRKRAEERLRETQEREREREQRFRTIFDTAPVGLSVIGPDGRFLRVNRELARILERPAEALLELGVGDVTAPGDLPPSAAALRRSFATGETLSLDKHYRRPDGELIAANSTITPLPADGEAPTILAVTVDLTLRRRAEQALRDSEERLRLAIAIGRLATWDWNIVTGATDWSAEHYRMQGYAPGEVTPGFEAWVARVHPEDREGAVAALAAAREGHLEYVREFRSLWPDGTVRWCSAQGLFFYDGAGRAVRMIGVMQDVTEAREAVRALRVSEERLRQFGEASSDVLWIRDAETLHWTYLTPAFERIYGASRETALHGNDLRNWMDLVEPADRPTAFDAMRRVRNGERVSFDYRIRRPSDGAVRWLRNTDFPILGAQGRVAGVGGIGRDITEERALGERQQVLLAELQHRTRNLLGVVRAVADRTALGAASLEDFLPRFRDRMGALSRINSLLSKLGQGERVTFDALIRTELEVRGVLGAEGGDRVALEGPADVRLRSAGVQTFALAIHELATNAVKYGALAGAEGRLTVRWRVERDGDAGPDRLRVEWTESGVPGMPDPGEAPRGGGYGRELIERALPYQLHARTRYEIGADGVRCTIDLPLR